MAFRLAFRALFILKGRQAYQPRKVFAESSIFLFPAFQRSFSRLTPRARAFVSEQNGRAPLGVTIL